MSKEDRQHAVEEEQKAESYVIMLIPLCQLTILVIQIIQIGQNQKPILVKDVLRKRTSERAAGMTYVALSRVRRISHLVIEPMTFEQLKAVKKNSNFKYRKLEELCLRQLARKTLQIHNAKQF
jgi:hypothetical protein